MHLKKNNFKYKNAKHPLKKSTQLREVGDNKDQQNYTTTTTQTQHKKPTQLEAVLHCKYCIYYRVLGTVCFLTVFNIKLLLDPGILLQGSSTKLIKKIPSEKRFFWKGLE